MSNKCIFEEKREFGASGLRGLYTFHQQMAVRGRKKKCARKIYVWPGWIFPLSLNSYLQTARYSVLWQLL